MVFVIHWHELAMDLHVFPIPIPPPTSLSTRSLWVFPVHQVRALDSCISILRNIRNVSAWAEKKKKQAFFFFSSFYSLDDTYLSVPMLRFDASQNCDQSKILPITWSLVILLALPSLPNFSTLDKIIPRVTTEYVIRYHFELWLHSL